MKRFVAVTVAALWGAACGSSSSGGGAVATTPDASTGDAAPAPAIPPPASTNAKVLAGYQDVLARGCASCHEAADPSLGPLSGQDSPAPGTTAYGSNLTPDPDTGMDAWTAAQIAGALRMGVDNLGAKLCPTMPTYPMMSDTEADDIALYLQSLSAVHHLVMPSMCPPIKPAPDAGDDGGDGGDDGGGDAGDDGGGMTDAGDDGG